MALGLKEMQSEEKSKRSRSFGQQYIEHRLDSLKKQADDNKYPTPGFPRLVVELDGSQIRY